APPPLAALAPLPLPTDAPPAPPDVLEVPAPTPLVGLALAGSPRSPEQPRIAMDVHSAARTNQPVIDDSSSSRDAGRTKSARTGPRRALGASAHSSRARSRSGTPAGHRRAGGWGSRVPRATVCAPAPHPGSLCEHVPWSTRRRGGSPSATRSTA